MHENTEIITFVAICSDHVEEELEPAVSPARPVEPNYSMTRASDLGTYSIGALGLTFWLPASPALFPTFSRHDDTNPGYSTLNRPETSDRQ